MCPTIYLKDYEFLKLVEFMKNTYGINLENKRHLIEGRFGSHIMAKGYHSFGDYFESILSKNSADEITILVNKLTTNHTFFMREVGHFDFFQKSVLPWLYQEVKDRDLRVWSAGCSSGEEAYTLAMIMQDFFGGEGRRFDKRILATDISEQVLHKAVRGIYTKKSIEGLKEHWKNQFFKKINSEEYQICEQMRKEIFFRKFNLMDTFPFKKKFHTIFCRNVMIYFDQETKNRLIQKFYDMTEDGGYLFIGMSESIGKDKQPYQYVMPSVYRKG